MKLSKLISSALLLTSLSPLAQTVNDTGDGPGNNSHAGAIVYANPAYNGMIFEARTFKRSNQNLANKICFLLSGRKSFKALDFRVLKKNAKELVTLFPNSMDEYVFATRTRAKVLTTVSDIMIDGYMNTRDADLAFVDPIITQPLGGQRGGKIKYFSSLKCEISVN